MDLKRWTHIVAVADRRSFVRAAEQVHLSQPALTRSIQAAEAELGLLLFDRGTQEVVPTPAGEFIVARARQLVFDNRCLERDVALYRSHELGDTAFGVGPLSGRDLPGAAAGRDAARVPGHQPAGRDQQLATAAGAAARGGHRVLRRRHRRPADRQQPGPAAAAARARRLLRARRASAGAAQRAVTVQQLWAYGVLSVRLPQGVRGRARATARLGIGGRTLRSRWNATQSTC